MECKSHVGIIVCEKKPDNMWVFCGKPDPSVTPRSTTLINWSESLKADTHDTSVHPPPQRLLSSASPDVMLIIMTLNTHLLVLFFRVSMSSLRKRKPSWCAVCVGGWGTAGLLWAGADLDRRVVSPGSLGRGRRLGLGLSRARGRSRREDFSGTPLGTRGTSPRAWGWGGGSWFKSNNLY